MKRSPEVPAQTIHQTESQASNQEASPLFDALLLEYTQNAEVNDLEAIRSDTGAAVAMFLEGTGNDAARNAYKDALNAIPSVATENEIPGHLEKALHVARQLDPTFPRVAVIYQSGEKTFYNAGTDQGTTGLAVVSNARGIRLGENEKAGVVDELTQGYKLVIADNALLDQLEIDNALTLKGITGDEGGRELYPLYGAVLVSPNIPGEHKELVNSELPQGLDIPKVNMTPAERRLNNKRLNKDRQAKQARDAAIADNGASLPDSDITQAFANKIQTQIDATRSTTVLGFSEMFRLEMEKAEEAEKERLTARVEKYTEKVATYEDIAAAALARRMKGRLFNPLTRKNKEKVKEDDLNMHLLEGFSRALDGAMMKQWLAEGYSDDEAAQMIYEHQQTRQEARAARNHEELRKGKLGSFLDKYANMSKGEKIGVAIGATAAFGAIGLVAGAAGGALAITGGIGLAGAKVGKTYLQHRSKIYETGRDESLRSPDVPVSVSNGNAETRTAAHQVFAGMDHDEKKREKAIQKADRIKKVAAGLAAISAVAIGAGVAMKVAEHADDINKFWNKTLEGNNTGKGIVEAPAMTPEPAPELAPTPAPYEFSADASTITNGEGWYQTFNEAGITDPSQQYALLNNQALMQELTNRGLAYPDAKLGGWGISMTTDGKMPVESLELIRAYAEQGGYDLAS